MYFAGDVGVKARKLCDVTYESMMRGIEVVKPGARLVKAFNTIYFRHLATEGNTSLRDDERRAIFVAGDDAEAKVVVAGLIRDLGFASVDAGTLRDGVKLQPGAPVYNQPLTGAEARQQLAKG